MIRLTLFPAGEGFAPQYLRRWQSVCDKVSPQLDDAVAQQRRPLEVQVLGGLLHLLFQLVNQPGLILARHAADGILGALLGDSGGRPNALRNVLNGLFDALRRDAVLAVVVLLDGAAAVDLVHGALHAVGDDVGVHDDVPVDMARGAAHGLDERLLERR